MEDQALEPPRPALSSLRGGFGLTSFVGPIPSKADDGLSAAGPSGTQCSQLALGFFAFLSLLPFLGDLNGNFHSNERKLRKPHTNLELWL